MEHTTQATLDRHLARNARVDIANWRIANLQNQVALINAGEPKAAGFIVDLLADTSVEELDDTQLQHVIKCSTHGILRSFGYEGAKSPRGLSITPFHTALLYKVKREFGDASVRLGVRDGYRGFLNTTQIRRFYSEEAQRLIRRLLNAMPDTGYRVDAKDYGKNIVLNAWYNNQQYIALHDQVVQHINASLRRDGKPDLFEREDGTFHDSYQLRGGPSGGIFVLKN